MKPLIRFLQYLSKTDTTIIQYVSDRAKKTQTAKGLFVLFSGLYWLLAGLFTLNLTFLGQWLWTVPVAVGLSIMILFLDREIVGSISLKTLPIRFALALFMGLVASFPLKMALVQERIEQDLIEQSDLKNQQLRERLTLETELLLASLDASIEEQGNVLQQFQEQATLEIDFMRLELLGLACPRCSEKTGKGPAYQLAEQAADHYEKQSSLVRAKLGILEEQRRVLLDKREADYVAQAVEPQAADLAVMVESLERVKSRSEAVNVISWLITLLFVLLETTPIIVKVTQDPTDYDLILKHDYTVRANCLQEAVNRCAEEEEKPMECWYDVLSSLEETPTSLPS